MNIGIGLPNFIPNTPGTILLDWSELAEQLGFSTIATIDRIAYPTYESLIALSAVAAVTKKIRIQTNILLAPIRNPVLLAKEAASLNSLSNGRLTLGLGLGSRVDDYNAVGKNFGRRGRILDEAIETMTSLWYRNDGAVQDHSFTPLPVEKIPILIGGMTSQTLRRIISWGDGWTASGVEVDKALPFINRVREEWIIHGREGNPKIVALIYFALGNDAVNRGKSFLLGYYSYLGEYAKAVSDRLYCSTAELTRLIRKFETIGIDELILFPTVNDLDQVNILARSIM